MNANIKIRKITLFSTIVSLLLMVILDFTVRNGYYNEIFVRFGCPKIDLDFSRIQVYYDVALAIFGSSALSYLTAKISFNSDIRKIKRTVISNVLQIQAEVKKILSEYDKVLNDWDENDFYEVHSLLNKLIGEFMSYSNAIKFETGKEIAEIIKVKNILEIYKLYINLNGEIHIVGVYLKNQNRKSAYEIYIKCKEFDEEIIGKIIVLLEKEYGRKFSDINSIGLL